MSSRSSRLINISPFVFLLAVVVCLFYVIPNDPTEIGGIIKLVLAIAAALLAAGIVAEILDIVGLTWGKSQGEKA